MRRIRFNRSLSSIKSPAPAFASLRSRYALACDFRCTYCGEVLHAEKEAFQVLCSFFADASGDAANAPSVAEWVEGWPQLTKLIDEANVAMTAAMARADETVRDSAEWRARSQIELQEVLDRRRIEREAWMRERVGHR